MAVMVSGSGGYCNAIENLRTILEAVNERKTQVVVGLTAASVSLPG